MAWFTETGMSGDSRTAPHNKERGPYYYSGHVRVGEQGDLTYGSKGYGFPAMDKYDIHSGEQCGGRGSGGNRWGMCRHWRVGCEEWWRRLYDTSRALTDQFVSLATADTAVQGTVMFGGTAYTTPAGACTVKGSFALAMQTIADAIGSFDPWTGLNYPRRGDPGFIDRRLSQIFGGETSRSGLWPDPYGDLSPQNEAFWFSQDADSRMLAYDDTYSEVMALGLGDPGTSSMPSRKVHSTLPAHDPPEGSGDWLYSRFIARMTGNASFCRHIYPRSYAECGTINDKGQCQFGIPARWVTPLSAWDDLFGELRQRCREALVIYQQIPAIAELGGIQEACAHNIALAPQGAAAPEASQDMAQYAQLEVDRVMVEKGELYREGRTEADEQLAILAALEASQNGAPANGAAPDPTTGLRLPAKLALGGAAAVAALLLWRRYR